MIKASDYIARFIADIGVRHVFSVAGGHLMHLMDSIAHRSPVQYVAALHEQAAAMMAKTYARRTENYGVCMVTSGPGGTNTLTGVASAWHDSTPCMFLSGQFRVETLPSRSGIRQMAPQMYFPVEIVRSITKYAALVLRAEDIRYHLEKAYYLSRSGRPGPVWLDIPLDVQGTEIEPDVLRGFDPAELQPATGSRLEPRGDAMAAFWELLRASHRPVVLAGNGVRLSGSMQLLREFVERLRIPIQTTLSGFDLIEYDHPLFMGRPNYWGQRHANFIIQNCDLLISIGAGLHYETTGYHTKAFARAAKKVVVDIDADELKKDTVCVDLPIQADCRAFLESALQGGTKPLPVYGEWIDYCTRLRTKFSVVDRAQHLKPGLVSPYAFWDVMSELLSEGDTIIPGNAGMHFTVAAQALRVKRGQRVISEIGAAVMGHSLPSSIGAAFAIPSRRVVCVTGDGGIQVNLQELQTILTNNLPIKLFVMDNGGYASLVNTQRKYFNGRLVGCTRESGLGLPSLERLLGVYGFEINQIADQSELFGRIRENLASPKAFASIVKTDPGATMSPIVPSRMLKNGQMASLPLEELAPPLSEEEFMSCMLIDRFVEE